MIILLIHPQHLDQLSFGRDANGPTNLVGAKIAGVPGATWDGTYTNDAPTELQFLQMMKQIQALQNEQR